MPSVLVVDDSTTDRHVVGILLTKAGDWNIQYAVQGRDALEQMENHEFDLVLTDLVMPGMDGLDLVAAIRGRHPHVPVILMTSRGNQTLALQALKQGAVDYIPKRLMPRKLTGTIRRVMAVACREREHVRLLGSMAEFRSSFVLANDVALIQPLVRYLQENVLVMRLCDEVECMQIGIALGEALFNTLYHGNLEVGAYLHTESEEAFESRVARRCVEPPYCDRRIHMAVTLTRDQGTFVIRDEGPGFDPLRVPDLSDTSALEKASGRGLILMRLFMDEVIFDETGREVTLTRSRKTASSRKPAAESEPKDA
ncbi:MAG: response regulator [Thermoguttaceae bacterium]